MSKKNPNPNPSEVHNEEANVDESRATTEPTGFTQGTSHAGGTPTADAVADQPDGAEPLGTPGNHPLDTKPDLAPPAAAPQAVGDDFVRRDPEEVVGKVIVLSNGIIVDRVHETGGGGFRYAGYYVGNVDTTKASLGVSGELKYFNADQIVEIATATAT